MKTKLLLFAAAFALVGAGCLGLGGDATQQTTTTQSNWTLSFALPEGWAMVGAYDQDSGVNLDREISKTTSEVILQSTDKTVWLNGEAPSEEVVEKIGEYVTDDYTYISVTMLDPRRVVPSEAEDLGDGFFRLTRCEEGEDCTLGGRSRFDYYFETDAANYKFEVTTGGQNEGDAVDVIMSAQSAE